MSDQWTDLFNLGDNGLTAYGWRPNKPARAKGLAPDFERKVSDELKSRCRIYFPSQETVEQSKGGAKVGEAPISPL